MLEENNEQLNDELQEPAEDQQPIEAIQEEAVQEETPELQKAKTYGYLTREEYIAKHGTDEGFKSPEQFNKFGESYGEVKDLLKGLKSKLDQRDKELEASLKYIENVRDREREKAKLDLANALQHAKEIGDVDRATELVREQTRQEMLEQQTRGNAIQDEAVKELSAFKERNKHWYNEQHPELVQRAAELDEQIRSGEFALKHGIPTPTTYGQLARQIELVMKQEYPDLIGIPEARQAAPVISQTSSDVNKSAQAKSATRVFNSLSDDHKALYSGLSRLYEKSTGNKLTYERFIQKLKDDGEI